jgi:hypothetical protein
VCETSSINVSPPGMNDCAVYCIGGCRFSLQELGTENASPPSSTRRGGSESRQSGAMSAVAVGAPCVGTGAVVGAVLLEPPHAASTANTRRWSFIGATVSNAFRGFNSRSRKSRAPTAETARAISSRCGVEAARRVCGSAAQRLPRRVANQGAPS